MRRIFARLPLISLLFLCLRASACVPSTASTPVAPAAPPSKLSGTAGFPWWNDAVFYEIFVRSYADSTDGGSLAGDGIGDINGLIQRLDYLNDGDPTTSDDLGVTALWLMPVHPSPSYHGYDVTDYYAINPQYGTLEDFKHLLAEAHRRGMSVVIDLVLNHTSSQHPWFEAAQDPASGYRDWYIWSSDLPAGGGWHETPSGYYYGIFDVGMPDLNYENPAVTPQMQDVARFWLQEVGVDGFRLDAAKHLLEDGTVQAHATGTHEWLKGFRTYSKGLSPQALTVGEVWDNSVTVAKYLQGDELDLAFDFDLAQALMTSARVGKAGEAGRILSRDVGLFPDQQFATFLTNHDQARSMTVLGDDPEKGKATASMLLTMPGVPFLYYGEEIGMLGKKPDEMIRTPMQWSAEANAGFSSGQPWEAVNPDYAAKNVAAQLQAPDSLLAHYRSLIHLRRTYPALRVGETMLLESSSPQLLAYLRLLPAQKNAGVQMILIVINLDEGEVVDYQLSLEHGRLSGEYQGEALFGTPPSAQVSPLTADAAGGFDAYQPLPSLPAYGTLIVQLTPANP